MDFEGFSKRFFGEGDEVKSRPKPFSFEMQVPAQDSYFQSERQGLHLLPILRWQSYGDDRHHSSPSEIVIGAAHRVITRRALDVQAQIAVEHYSSRPWQIVAPVYCEKYKYANALSVFTQLCVHAAMQSESYEVWSLFAVGGNIGPPMGTRAKIKRGEA